MNWALLKGTVELSEDFGWIMTFKNDAVLLDIVLVVSRFWGDWLLERFGFFHYHWILMFRLLLHSVVHFIECGLISH